VLLDGSELFIANAAQSNLATLRDQRPAPVDVEVLFNETLEGLRTAGRNA
jgi:hypothetical protein